MPGREYRDFEIDVQGEIIMQLEERVVRLERSARRWRVLALVLIVAVVAVAAGVGLENGEWKNIKAERISLMDNLGQERAFSFIASNTRNPGIWFLDRWGKERLFVGITEDDTGLIVCRNAKGEDVRFFAENVGGTAGAPGAQGFGSFLNWPGENSREWRKTVYFNTEESTENDKKSFHTAKCIQLDRTFRSGRSMRQAKKLGKTPCKECFKNLWK